jgi:hypothetical protein
MSTTNEGVGPRGFAVMLTQLREGEFHAECSEELQTLMKNLDQHAIKTGKKAKGVLTLKLSFEVDDRGFVQVMPDVARKEPKPIRGAGIFFMNRDGNLSQENERQPKLPFTPREVPQPATRVVPAPEKPDAKSV